VRATEAVPLEIGLELVGEELDRQYFSAHDRLTATVPGDR
jgi:hypothetical protein